MEKINWRDHIRNEEVLLRVKGEENFLLTIKRRKYKYIGPILCGHCLLKHVSVAKIEGARRRARSRKQLQDYPKET